MANINDISALTYQPSTNMDWYTKAIFGGKLIEKGKITPVIGIKESTLLNLIDLTGNILQADGRDCAWTPQQIAKLSEKELKIKTYKINLEQCIDDLERKRTVWMLTPGAKNAELPDGLEDATMMLLANELSNEIEAKIFNGDSSVNPDDFNGVLKVLADSTTAKKRIGATLTRDNVLSEIEEAITLVPTAVLSKGVEDNSLNIYVSYSTLLKVKLSFSKVYNNNVVIDSHIENGEVIKFMGLELVPVKGIGENDIIIADSKNFLLGTDLMNDLEEMRLGNFSAPNDNKIFIDGRLRLGFVIPFEDEVVFSSPTVTAVQGFAAPVTASTGKAGYDGNYPIVDGIDQTPIYKLPKVGDLTNQIKASQSIDEIQAIIETEAHTLRASKDLIATGENRINELKGGE